MTTIRNTIKYVFIEGVIIASKYYTLIIFFNFVLISAFNYIIVCYKAFLVCLSTAYKCKIEGLKSTVFFKVHIFLIVLIYHIYIENLIQIRMQCEAKFPIMLGAPQSLSLHLSSFLH